MSPPRVGSLGDKIAGSPEIRLRMKGPFCRTQELRGERSIHNNIFHLETVAKKNCIPMILDSASQEKIPDDIFGGLKSWGSDIYV